MICDVELGRRAAKQIERVPRYVAQKLLEWVRAVEVEGLDEVRKLPGFHDEPLHGRRRGQRSIRLTRAYRAVYVESHRDGLALVRVEEVSKHDY